MELWRHLLATRSAISLVVEEGGRPAARGLVGFGASVFVTDAFVEEIKVDPAPHIALRVLSRWLRGSRVFLSTREIARQHASDGLNLAILHYGLARMPEPDLVEIGVKLIEAFFWGHAGYRINEFFEVVYGGPKDLAMRLSNGLRLCREFEAPQGSRSSGACYLVTAHRSDLARADANLALSKLFHAPPARFGLSTPERGALQQALLGETDREMAKSLGVSVWTIKKRWQGIYEKVEAVDGPAQQNPELDADEALHGRRRWRLLDYVRQHMEEIRPVYVPGRRGRTALTEGSASPAAARRGLVASSRSRRSLA